MRRGDMRSGSANTASKATAAAPAAPSRRTRSAKSVLGHGHCPSRVKLSLSMSMIRTGASGSYSRGAKVW